MKNFIAYILLLFLINSTLKAQIGFSIDTTTGCNSLNVNVADTNNLSGFQYRIWNFGDGDTASSQTITHQYDTAGIYTLTLIIKTNSDSLTASKNIIVRKRPVASFEIKTFGNKSVFGDTLYFSYNKIVHKSTSAIDTLPYHYTWIFDNDTLADTSATITKMYETAGEHNVSLIVEAFNQCSDTATQSYTIEDEILIPNIFTPNGDGMNDIFYAQTDGEKLYELNIFSRFGTLVYTITSTKVWWDGRTHAGEELTPGTYYYVLKEVDGDKVIKGSVYLSR